MVEDSKPAVDRVIVTVFDGLRPDLVTPELTPNILRVAARGTWFREARSVFPSVTRVATTSIATGAPPTVHGIVGNAFYHREALPDAIFMTGDIDHIRRAEAYHGGRMVEVDTLGDVLAKAGKRLAVVHTGSAGATHFINPRARTNGHWTFSMHGVEGTQTPEAVTEAIAHVGPLPKRELPRLDELRYAATLMVDYVLPKLAPDVAIVWFNEPDTTFHYKGLGSPEAKAGLAEADRGLGAILDWVESQPDRDRIAVIVASDHGQISTGAVRPLFADAAAAGFKVNLGRDISEAALTVTGGISGEIRLRDGDAATVGRLARWLMEQPDVGHVFSRARNDVEGEIAGTLSLDLIGNGHMRQPDLMFILRSDLSKDPFGLPGLGIMTPGDVPLGGGMHGGINPHELNTVLIVGAETAEGRGGQTAAPAGIIDIAPTVLGLIGIAPAPTMQGRNLARPAADEPQVTRHSAGDGRFAQHVDMVAHAGRRFILGGGH
ncbi:alkaline phosphatase family protein [Chelatococcus asaccharovorans]|uniref:Putative AlkP superfamily pyrophosphatase or phosphodiesterase n=1 Tax=Chelatococcus asaccharovorans TaxID=28210 RepID=A0A2V3UEK2_9HYPH|nr:alkaline phosphatase family protein [Chelatococcus asaccharovorans]MBS7706981.1 alkaline phosphatase family protein [Chelatococcus asaccharovorans]PXW63161.1 putative AlkP superfamily pyrophosphatase or phosphodiesterase [Chelatococcus asaccharovorans]CAH1653571.1 putative AlkP superfamily pyrophosphatase or phosphodiesterase [Chelatococcus asaccharovorans]CAH1694198.1 putative AlkP superfamily pyrophosphatase or phosphodiesterase [Chelatococcus asaccharovorans]